MRQQFMYQFRFNSLRSFVLFTAVLFGLGFAITPRVFAQDAELPQAAGTKASRTDNEGDDEMSHRAGLNDWLRQRATAGSDKSWEEIERTGYDAMMNMSTNVSYKDAVIPSWVPIGGSIEGRVSGRIRGIAFDPSNPKVVYIAAAQGGVWMTSDITANTPVWVSLSDHMPTLVMGAVAVAKDGGNTVIYAGTGEVQGGFSTPGGNGIYQSVDGGNTWKQVLSVTAEGGTCGQIAVDPGNPKHILAATGNNTGSLQITNDGGATWTKATGLGDAVSVVFDPVTPANVYVGSQSGGGIWRSTNGGTSWTKAPTLTGGNGGPNNVALAICASTPNVIYAGVGNTSATSCGIFASTDFGVSWRIMNKTTQIPAQNADQNPSTATSYPNRNYTIISNGQAYYDNAIAVNPQNAQQIVVGGIDVWTASDSGKSLVHSGYWTAGVAEGRYVHADCHVLAYNGSTLFACSDGGIFMSNNNGINWTSATNSNINTFQYVGADANPDFTYVLGGTQDNGAIRSNIGSNVSREARGGDAGITWIADDGQTCYSTYVNADFEKSLDSGNTWQTSNLTGSTNFIANTTLLTEGRSLFYPAWDVFPDGKYVVYSGTSHLFISGSGGDDGFVGGMSATSNINAATVLIFPTDPTIAWAGSYSGKVWRSYDASSGGSHWASSTLTGAGSVNGLATDPTDQTHLWAVAGGNNKHFFVSTDTGRSWTAPATNFPNVPAQSIARDPSNGNLFVGTDFGVVFSTDNGGTWQTLGVGLPAVQVLSLKVKNGNLGPVLLASTFGRGVYYVPIVNLGVGNVAPIAPTATLHAIYPNPATAATTSTISFDLPKSGVTVVTLHDVTGRLLQTIANANLAAGNHALQFSTASLASGTYVCAVTTNGATMTEKFEVSR